MDDGDAVDALSHLGLTGYEARVFVGLQKLETGTAREVARVVDVPRSQVYSTADSLEARGLVEVQNASPTRYRAVDLEEGMDRLYERLDRERRRATEYLREVRGSLAREGDDRQPNIWVTRGTTNVGRRVEELLATAEERVVVGVDRPTRLPDSTVEALAVLVDAGVTVVGVSEHERVVERFGSVPGLERVHVPDGRTPNVATSRLLVVDDRTVLVGMVDDGGGERETAMWSEDTTFAALLARLVDGWFEQYGERVSSE
ncbi:TrmB family transcriptional regulator [Halomarina ordinaria]|uniref:TrmB family transcriptional regulator n=1 Tax=Halomarina ordinaria TaxID=3033939 RepID=A0ABD5UBV7_9EURY|nr:helix-turn-helix domain-containing protein [Halomarina sp. PSRA2]